MTHIHATYPHTLCGLKLDRPGVGGHFTVIHWEIEDNPDAYPETCPACLELMPLCQLSRLGLDSTPGFGLGESWSTNCLACRAKDSFGDTLTLNHTCSSK